jgi:indolepyruvate ferredoxin oxidoreductase beta subunit
MSALNIYISGVGGQGIGMLSEVLSRACLDAGHRVTGCDTHGLAQRGGIVVSHLRLGEGALTPRVPEGAAQVVVALERLEALRAATTMLASGGTVIYYDAVYQPIHVRMGQAGYPDAGALERAVARKGGRLERVFVEGLEDPRMQNVALLGRLAAIGAIDGVGREVMRKALEGSIPKAAMEANAAVFEQAAGAARA